MKFPSANDRILFLCCGWIIAHCAYMLHFLRPFIHQCKPVYSVTWLLWIVLQKHGVWSSLLELCFISARSCHLQKGVPGFFFSYLHLIAFLVHVAYKRDHFQLPILFDMVFVVRLLYMSSLYWGKVLLYWIHWEVL